MKLRSMILSLASLLALVVASQVARAQDDEMLDPMQAEPEAEASAVSDDYSKCGKGCCETDCCGSGGVYGEFQYLDLEAFATEEAFDDDVGSEDGYRIVVGYEDCDGLGIRFRYFDYDGTQVIENDEAEGLDLEYFDIEVTDAISICNLHGVVSAGYRHAEYETLGDDNDVDFEGDGVTLGVVVNREISCNLSLYAWAQHSIIYGDDDENDVEDTLMGWTEIQLGAQYDTCVGGYNAFLRGGVEADRMEGMEGNDTQDTGLFGWFLSAGVGF